MNTKKYPTTVSEINHLYIAERKRMINLSQTKRLVWNTEIRSWSIYINDDLIAKDCDDYGLDRFLYEAIKETESLDT